MKKKLMLVAALVGVLSLSACVDDKESASVEAVRSAKAEQLKAMAALDKAKAEAELIYANAEKALLEAKAEYEKAKAAAENANAEYQKQMTEQAKQEFAAKIEKIKAQAQADLMLAKKQAAQYEKDLLDIEDQRIKNLFIAYNNEAFTLANQNEDLATANINLTLLQANLINAEAYVKERTLYYNNEIASYTAKKTALAALPANDKAALQKEMQELLVKRSEAFNAITPALDVQSKAYDSFDKALNNFAVYNVPITSTLKTVIALNALSMDYNLPLERKDVVLTEEIATPDYIIWSNPASTFSIKESNILAKRKSLTEDLADYKKNTLGSPKTDTDPGTGKYLAVETAEENLADAKEALEDAKDPDSGKTADEIAALEKVVKEKEIELAWANEQLEAAKVKLENDYQKPLDKFETLVASLSGEDKAAYDKALEDVKKLAEAYVAAQIAYYDANEKYTELGNLYTSVRNIYYSTTDIQEEIAFCDTQIAGYQKNIANLNNSYSIDSAAYQKALIANQEEIIANLKTQIEAQKVIVAKAKAALDAALK